MAGKPKWCGLPPSWPLKTTHPQLLPFSHPGNLGNRFDFEDSEARRWKGPAQVLKSLFLPELPYQSGTLLCNIIWVRNTLLLCLRGCTFWGWFAVVVGSLDGGCVLGDGWVLADKEPEVIERPWASERDGWGLKSWLCHSLDTLILGSLFHLPQPWSFSLRKWKYLPCRIVSQVKENTFNMAGTMMNT